MGTASSKKAALGATTNTTTSGGRPMNRTHAVEDEEDESFYPVLSNWVVAKSALLCRAVAEEQPLRFLQEHNDKHQISAAHCSVQGVDGSLLLVDVTDEDRKQYLFIVFGSDSSLSNSLSNLATFQKRGEKSLVVPQFKDRSLGIRTDYFSDQFKQGKSIVVTGHSIGGACATLLTERIINSFLHLKVCHRLMCVTFGAPIITGRYTERNIRLNKELYNHFVIVEDVLPRVLCVDRNNSIFEREAAHEPTGKIFKLKCLGQQLAECKLLDDESRAAFYFPVVPNGVDTVQALGSHAMSEYEILLIQSNVIIQSPPAEPIDAELIAEIAVISYDATVSLCTLIGLELEIRGTNLSMVEKVKVGGVEVASITYHTSTCMICRVSESLTTILDTSNNMTNVELTNCFGEVSFLSNVDLRLVGTAKANVFPSALLASVLPLTALIVNGGTLTNDMMDTLEDIRKHVKGVESSIPVEFAFNMMTKNGRDFEDKDLKMPVNAQDNLIYLYMFLKRLAEVEIANWPKLCSTHMLRVLKDSIGNLETMMIHEQDGQIRKLLDEAFKPVVSSNNVYTNQWFDDAYSTLCKEDYDSIFCTNQAQSKDDYWNFVTTCVINVGFSFVHGNNGSKSVNDNFLHFRENSWNNENNSIVVKLDSMEKVACESGARDFSIVQRSFAVRTTINNVTKQRTFYHFEFSHDQEPSKWISSKAIVKSIANTLVRAKELESEANKAPSNAANSPNAQPGANQQANVNTSVYHVQSFDNSFYLSTWFILNWFLSYNDGSTLDQSDIDRTFSALQEEIPLSKQSNPAYEASLKIFHDTLTSTLQKRYQFVQGFFIKNNPRKKVLARLKHVRAEMLSNYYSIVPPFFCGLGVDFTVKENQAAPGKNRRTAPFFNFIPKPLTVETTGGNALSIHDGTNQDNDDNNTLTLNDVVERAEQASAGLQFMLLMMDKYEILTKQELFQTHNDAATTAMRAAAVPLAAIPKVFTGAYKVVRYLTTGEFSHIIDASSGFRYLFNSVYFSEQKVESYNDFLDQLISNLQLSVQVNGSKEVQISEKLDCIFKSIPPVVGDMSVKDLIRNSDQIFANTPWFTLLDSRSKMLHIFMMKQIFHCYHIRSLRSKFVIVGINGEKNAGKTTLCSLLLGGETVKSRRGLNMDDSTIFPTAYVDPVDLPDVKREADSLPSHVGSNTMIIDLPGCTDSLAYTIPSLFFPAIDISIFVISSRQSKKCDSSLSQFINAFVSVRKGPTLLCINGYDKHLEDCIDFNHTYIEHATVFTPKSNALDVCDSILRKEKAAWQQSATLRLPNSGPEEQFIWNCERSNPKVRNCVVHSSLPSNDYPLSIWMTSFLVDQVRYSFANEHLMNSTHVRQWINEARAWYTTATYRLNIVDTTQVVKRASVCN